jgi:hypothetical protein
MTPQGFVLDVLQAVRGEGRGGLVCSYVKKGLTMP